tara:strand:+ start:5334 stop:5993 length:660 start_codon:yes stop_codon:yes gene_type:complete
MSQAPLQGLLEAHAQSGGLWDFGPELSRLLIQMWREVAKGEPVTAKKVDQIATALEVEREAADVFLRAVSERDEADNIIGCLGLSQKEYAHRFMVDGVQLWAWCAADTLFLPAMLSQSATVESVSPLNKEKIALTIHPNQIQEVHPSATAVSFPLIDPEDADMSSPEAIWGSFCHRIYFFASQEEGEQWAAQQGNIAVVSVEEAFAFTTALWAKVLVYV